jgi:hypothetical protein
MLIRHVVTLRSDNGLIKFFMYAPSPESAIAVVLNCERAPKSALRGASPVTRRTIGASPVVCPSSPAGQLIDRVTGQVL